MVAIYGYREKQGFSKNMHKRLKQSANSACISIEIDILEG